MQEQCLAFVVVAADAAAAAAAAVVCERARMCIFVFCVQL